MFKFELTEPKIEFTLEGFIEILKKILDGIYDAFWGKKAEDAE